MYKSLAAGLAAVVLALAVVGEMHAAVSYTTAGSLYMENFDGLPLDMPSNGSIQALYPTGWQNDTPTVAGTSIGLTGWYLYHPATATPEGGATGHERVRVGPGANTGSFWLFGAAATNAEKALGNVGSTTVAANGTNLYMGLQLVNNTGTTLNSFTLTFDGEQWRDGQSPTGETLLFDYSTSATSVDWFNGATPFTPVAALNFTSPVGGGTGSAGASVDGNGPGLSPNISATVGGITWAPGTELWLRWADPQLASLADDGLAIDNVRFNAVVGGGNPNDVTSVMSGLASTPATWSNNQAPSVTNTYRVVNGHTVSVDAPFAGGELRANSGGTVNFSASAVKVPLMIIDAGANLTETVSGDFALGDISQTLGTLQLNGSASFAIAAGGNFYTDVKLIGSGDINFSAGAGSNLWLSDTAGHNGVIRFNGSGDQVKITESNVGVGTLEMNSTGANTLFIDPKVQAESGTVIFNQAGTIDHAATQTSPNRRLQGVSVLRANAAVAVDLTKVMPDGAEERRFLIGTNVGTGMEGSGAVTVNGTISDSHVTGTVTLNEFEVGSTGEPAAVVVDAYAGTLTANNFVNVELRHSMPGAKVVVNNHARVEMGHQVTVPTAQSVALGEVEVNNGGILEVGFEQNIAGDEFPEGHSIAKLTLANANGRSGGLTMHNGGVLRMQVNGKDANTFDTIAASGPVVLDGELNILINPEASTGAATAFADLADYVPQINDLITIITTTAGGALASDFDGVNGVNGADFAIWKGAFGTSAAGDADDDGDSDGVDFLKWQSEFGASAVPGAISGAFDAINVTDPTGAMAGKAFQVVLSGNSVQLKVVAAISSVPEPTGLALAAAVLLLPAIRRRHNRS